MSNKETQQELTEKELDRLANSGAELPEGLNYADTLYFLCKRALYRYARDTDMPAEQGRRESAKIREIVRAYKMDNDYVLACARRTMAVEQAITEYRKAMDDKERLAAAAQLVMALDGAPVGKGETKLGAENP